MNGLSQTDQLSHDTALPHYVRIAVAWMCDNASRPITARDIAHASGTTERSLHRQFRAFLGLPPMTWLRRWRLSRAHRDLLDPNGGPVADIAARHGFPHLSRFAADYRKAFGEAPAETRRQMSLRGASSLARIVVGSRAPIPTLLLTCPRTETTEERAMAEAILERLAAALANTRAIVLHTARSGDRTLTAERPRKVHDRYTPRTPAEKIAQSPLDPIGDTRARYCLRGRVARMGERVRITLWLQDLASGRHIWGDSIDGLTSDPFVLQDRVADVGLHGIIPGIANAEIGRLADLPSHATSARALALRALPLARAADVASARRLLALMEEAMAKDPGEALPVALAAVAHGQLASYFGTANPSAARAAAKRLSDQADLLDHADPLVGTARAAVAALCWRPLFEVELLTARAVALDPTNGWAWERWALMRAGRDDDPDLAIGDFARSARLSGPGMPAANRLNGMAFAHQNGGRFEESRRLLNEALVANPRAVWLHQQLVFVHHQIGDEAARQRSMAALRVSFPDLTVALDMDCRPGMPICGPEILSMAGLPLA